MSACHHLSALKKMQETEKRKFYFTRMQTPNMIEQAHYMHFVNVWFVVCTL